MAMKRGVLKWCPAAVLAAVTIAPGAAGAQSASNQTILEHFNIIAFGSEYTGQRHDHVRKWRAPILVGIEGKVPAYFETFVLQHIGDLQRLTSHPIRLYYSPTMYREGRLASDLDQTKVNLILYYLPVRRIPERLSCYSDNDPEKSREMIRTSTCFAKFGTRKNEIR